MTDKELLEFSAKASGIEGKYECWAGQGFKEGVRQVLNGAKCQRLWNPITDDGDALRLAVKLRQLGDVAMNEEFIRASCQDDQLSWTRRAIVCAAAEIGMAM